MTPEPEPGGAPCCDPPEGTPRVRTVTTEGRTFATTAGTDSSFCDVLHSFGLTETLGWSVYTEQAQEGSPTAGHLLWDRQAAAWLWESDTTMGEHVPPSAHSLTMTGGAKACTNNAGEVVASPAS